MSVAYWRAACISPLQWASGMRCTALAVASPRAIEARVLCTRIMISSFWPLFFWLCSSSAASMRFFRRHVSSPMMVEGMPSAAIKASKRSLTLIVIIGITPFRHHYF